MTIFLLFFYLRCRETAASPRMDIKPLHQNTERASKPASNALHWENYISIFFQIEWDMIVLTVLILNQMEIYLV